MNILFDTNLWIRHQVHDDLKQLQQVQKLLLANEESAIQIYTSSIILLEVSFILKSLYKFQKDEIMDVLDAILDVKNIILLESTDSRKALEVFQQTNIKFSDCLIATQLKEHMFLATFDRDFKKIPEVISKTPSEILSLLKN